MQSRQYHIWTNNIFLNFFFKKFQEQPPFDKKQFITYMKRYIKLLTAKLEPEKQELFKKNIEGATKFVLSKLKDLQLYVKIHLLWLYIWFVFVWWCPLCINDFLNVLMMNVSVLLGRVCTMMAALSLHTTRKVLLIQLLSTLHMVWRKSSAEHINAAIIVIPYLSWKYLSLVFSPCVFGFWFSMIWWDCLESLICLRFYVFEGNILLL